MAAVAAGLHRLPQASVEHQRDVRLREWSQYTNWQSEAPQIFSRARAPVAAARTNGLATAGPPTPAELVAGYHAGFLAAATLCLLGLLAALRLPRPAQAAPVSVPRPGGGRRGPARRRTRSPRGRAAR